MKNEMVPLSVAAQELGMSWERAWRRLLNGKLQGEMVGTRWHVTRKSLNGLKRTQAKEKEKA